jgi:hypothetical protein
MKKDVSEVCSASINRVNVLLMEAVHISETSIYFNEAKLRYILEGWHSHNRRRENLKSHRFSSIHNIIVVTGTLFQLFQEDR